MPELLPTNSDISQTIDELACYEQSEAEAITVAVSAMTAVENDSHLQQHCYLLPVGKLRLLNSTLHLPASASKSAIEGARQAVIKTALTWQKRCVPHDKQDKLSYYVLIIDIQLDNAGANTTSANKKSIDKKGTQPLSHSFGASYFMEELVLDITETSSILQVFSWQDWQAALATLKTPCDLWRFLSYHSQQLRDSITKGIATFDSEKKLLQQFRSSAALFTQAIKVDNAVINYAIQDKPNAALIAMSLAQKQGSMTAQMYQQHLQQAAMLWSQLSTQMIDLTSEKLDGFNSLEDNVSDSRIAMSAKQWQQQLLDESLFSRHELVRTIYKHPKQSAIMLEQGYVVHQHSYESLGRHYVLIFYGQGAKAQQSRQKIQPNLATIAQEVATRLPLEELHHVIVMGIAFIGDDKDTFIDIDLWIQPIVAMTAKERQLTKQLQRLSQQRANTLKSARADQDTNQKPRATTNTGVDKANPNTTKLPSLNLSLSIAANTVKK